MIIVRLMGGLGNQMFQYALGRRLSLGHQTSLRLDLSWFGQIAEGDTRRTYELDHFSIKPEFASESDIQMLTLQNGFLRGIRRKIDRIGPWHRRRTLNERHPGFDPFMLKSSRDVYLIGFWQSEKYFNEIRKTLIADFSFKADPDTPNLDCIRKARAVESVAVHLRRGDYVTNANTRAFHGLLPLSYYQEAMQRMETEIRDPHYFIFSDDPDWAGENLTFPNRKVCIVRHNQEKSHEDLRLMTQCRHHIIANSSFSWWGAWLAQHSGQRVIAPKQWFAGPAKTHDIIAESWTTL